MLGDIIWHLEALHDYAADLHDLNDAKQDSVKLNSELFRLWVDVIMFFRSRPTGKQSVKGCHPVANF